jgi:drug/metabolite transporter (DMT)-like permease
MLFLGEQFSTVQLGGAALIITAIVVLFLPAARSGRDEHLLSRRVK